MKKHINRKSVLITSVALLLLVAVGITLAYVFTKTDPVENKFNPSKVSCAVVENGSETEYTDDIVEIGATKKDVKIKNTGNTDAYIRVAVVVNWMSKDGKVWATKPATNEYTINYTANSDWSLGTDGYYYYQKPVAPGDLTEILINSATKNVDGPVGTDGTQYYLSIEIVASAIQADGMGEDVDTAQEAWAAAKTQPNTNG